jgi:DNA-binding NarL/FixJ family response regulator
MPGKIRLLLVDDHAIVREGYRRLLERRNELEIAGEAGSAEEALALFRQLAPDVTVLDLALPDMGGVELIGRLLQRDAAARILVFSMHRDPLFKSSSPEVLVNAVYQVAARRRAISPDIAPELALALLDEPVDPLRELSPREFEILRLLVGGRSVDEIGTTLHISPKTVQNCHYQIKAKLGVRSDIELTRLAIRLGLAD